MLRPPFLYDIDTLLCSVGFLIFIHVVCTLTLCRSIMASSTSTVLLGGWIQKGDEGDGMIFCGIRCLMAEVCWLAGFTFAELALS